MLFVNQKRKGKILFLLGVLFLFSSATANGASEKPAIIVNVEIKVIDKTTKRPVAEAEICYVMENDKSGWEKGEARTDASGIARFQGKDIIKVGFWVRKKGYQTLALNDCTGLSLPELVEIGYRDFSTVVEIKKKNNREIE